MDKHNGHLPVSYSQPKRADVVVVGGGIMGICLALELAERNISVVVCEKGEIAGEQSSRNCGWVRKMGRPAAELPLAIEAVRLWEGMSERIGADSTFRRTGIGYLFRTEKEVADNAKWLDIAKPNSLDTKVLSPRGVKEVVPESNYSWAGALYTPSDGSAEPDVAPKAIAAAAIRKGAILLENCAVRTVETTGGKASAVVTEHGRIDCNTVVIATGAWTSLFCRNLGIEFPQLKITTTVLKTVPMQGGPGICCSAPGFVSRRTIRNEYILSLHPGETYDIVPDTFRFLWPFRGLAKSHLGRVHPRVGKMFFEEMGFPSRWSADETTPFEKIRTRNPPSEPKFLEKLPKIVGEYFPALANFKIAQSWCGLIEVVPDALPVISDVETCPGLYVFSGFSGTGFAIAPGAAKLMAQTITGEQTDLKNEKFSLSRFKNGLGSHDAGIVGGTP